MADEDDKPGMGVSGVVTGAVGLGVGTGGAALIAHQRRRGKLTDEAKKHIDDGTSKKASDEAKKAFEEANKGTNAAENYAATVQGQIDAHVSKAEEAARAADPALAAHFETKTADQIYAAGLSAHTKKAAEDAKAAFRKSNAGAADEAINTAGSDAYNKAEEAFKKANPDAAKYAEEVAGKYKSIGEKAKAELAKVNVAVEAKLASKTPSEVLAAGAEHAGNQAAKTAEAGLAGKILKEDVTKKIAEEASKAAGATAETGAKAAKAAEEAAFAGVKGVKEASWIKKPVVAFKNMSGKGKAAAIGLGVVLAATGAMWMKARHQNRWQEQIDAERAANATQTAPAR